MGDRGSQREFNGTFLNGIYRRQQKGRWEHGIFAMEMATILGKMNAVEILQLFIVL
jgi:hypothetical protein